MKAKVSIIIPIYNGEKVIEHALRSCLTQKYKDFEIIVVDNGSTDNTYKVLSNFLDGTHNIKYLYTEIKGRSNARNLGIEIAEGEYIKFLDADDRLSEYGLKESVDFLEQNPDYFAICGTVSYVNTLNNNSVKKRIDKDINNLQFRNLFPINSVLFRNYKIIPFSNKLEYCEDWLFWFDNLWGKLIKIDNDILAGDVYVTGQNSMRNTRLMARYRSVVRANIVGKIEYKKYMYKEDIKSCLTYFWSYSNEEKHEKYVDQYMKKRYHFLFSATKMLYNFYPFKLYYNRRKNKQERKNYYLQE